MAKHPRVRETDLVTQALGDELLVFDSAANRAHSLNATATAVWRACDGTRSPREIAERCQLDPLAVELALHDLADAKLLADYTPAAERVSRRSVIRRLALTGASLGVALPVIRSIVAPSAALAGSTSINPRNLKRCRRTTGGVLVSSTACSDGSACLKEGDATNSSAFCLREPGASCYYHSSASASNCQLAPGSRYSGFQECPSTGVCPPV
jgi:hypothetical protein